MKEVGTSIYRLGEVEVHPLQGYIYRHGEELYLRPKSLHVLLFLIEHCDRRVSKEELMQAVWKEATVTDDALVQSIREIRKALGDDPHHPEFIKTFPRIGYHLICPVEHLSAHPHRMVHSIARSVIIEETTAVEIEFETNSSLISANNQPNALADAERRTLPGPVQSPSPFRKFLENRLAVISVMFVFLSSAIGLPIYLWRTASNTSIAIETKLPKLPGKKNIAVMYFENQSASRELDWLREGLADMLIADLSRSQKLIILSRQQLHLLLERSGYKAGKVIHLDEALELAHKTQAEVVALGSFANLGETTRIDVQLYDSQTGQLMATERLVADKPDEILRQIDLLSMRLAAHLGSSSEAQKAHPGLSNVMTNNLEAYRYYSLALEKAQAYHSTEAIRLWEKAIALDPEFAMAYARIGYTYALVRVNENEKAKPYLEKAFRLSTRLNEKEKLYIHAWYAHANNDAAMAVRALYDITAKYPQETESYFRLGFMLRHSMNRYEEAMQVFEQGIAADPEAKEIYNQLGFVYAKFGRYEEAIAAHRRYVQLAPDEPNAYDSLGMTYNEAGRYEEALDTFNQALRLSPDFHFANRHLGDSYFLIGRLNDALQQYQRYLRVAPSDWDRAAACNLLVRVYLAKDDVKSAENFARQESKYKNNFGGLLRVALMKGDLAEIEKLKGQIFSNQEAKPGGITAILGEQDYLLGYYFLTTGRTDQALQHFQKSEANSSYYWNADSPIASLADAYLELGRLDEAIAEYERLLKVNANFARTLYQLGRAYEQKHELDKARAAYRRFLEIWSQADTDAPLLLDAKKRLTTL
jgi:tetratricopeptide (TPR) repeat protein/DNA-binding winged helix-turn-helix (wHTH) protein